MEDFLDCDYFSAFFYFRLENFAESALPDDLDEFDVKRSQHRGRGIDVSLGVQPGLDVGIDVGFAFGLLEQKVLLLALSEKRLFISIGGN